MERFDIVIIGAGPGGVQLALTLREISRRGHAKIKYCIIEKESAPGGFFKRFPVHGQLISNNKLYSGRDPKSRFAERFDWNSLITEDREILTRNYSRDFYPRREIICKMLQDLCSRYALPIKYDLTVTSVERQSDGQFLIETEQGPVKSQLVVVATGLKPITATIPGIEHAIPYAEMGPASRYRDQQVLIIGKGNSGFECANHILNEASVIMLASRNPVRLAFQTHYVGNLRSINALAIENYQLKHHTALLDCEIKQIERLSDSYNVTVAYKHANNEVESLRFDAIIAATGFTGNLDVIDETFAPPRLHGKFPDIDHEFGCRGVEGLYFAGALTHGPDYRSFSSSGFIHGFRYNSVVLAHHVAAKLGVVEAPACIAGERLLDHLMIEFEEDAGCYLQPGYIGRCYRCTGDGTWSDLGYQTRRWFDTAPPSDATLLLATLEYGDIHTFPNVMEIPRSPGDPDKSVHIHPVVRAWNRGHSREVHLEESLLNRFSGITANRQRLEGFLAALNVREPTLLSAM
ncbi:Thioredoxin reductase [Bradyrhizobium sp. Ghvi]|uniref:NAD(P)-binding domain-containing protein n=1 Tax=Bradyrhizobium sp. Ghvi TaxID=1855319 RepID=UPI0008E22D3B|nr:NAD(P)-binding domain-containing protein [Bradyrhizobium sp. Ghvi]SFP56741.1 Thioredoxin reductase [Bradyrhizobium sp. Ghvi]